MAVEGSIEDRLDTKGPGALSRRDRMAHHGEELGSRGSGDSPSGAQGCPYCESELLEGSLCPRCGRMCEKCGTPYLDDDACPECSDLTSRYSGQSSPQSLGEAVPARIEDLLSNDKSFHRPRRTQAMLRNSFIDLEAETLNEKLNLACDKLPLSEAAKRSVASRVRGQLVSLVRDNDIGADRAIAFLIFSEMRRLGFSLKTTQDALGKAGVKIKLKSLSLLLALPTDSTLALRVNGFPRRGVLSEKRGEVFKNLLEMLGAPDYRVYTLRVQFYLSDIQNRERPISMELDDGFFIDRGALTRRLSIPLSGSKCFALFKTEKLLSVDKGRETPRLNPIGFVRSVLPSKVLPVSSELMRTAGKLHEVESAMMSKFRELIDSSTGRSPQKLAVSALYSADQSVFAGCSPAEKSRVAIFANEVTFQNRRDVNYTGRRGFLIPSEVDRACQRMQAT